MDTYDANHEPDAIAWLGLDEETRIALVAGYHRRYRPRTPQVRLHATFHTVVENQVAAKEPVVVETLNRLQSEGLSRHDAVHAIGSILAAQVYDMLKRGQSDAGKDPNEAYAAELRKLTAES
ncbi:MAG: hypothetical protein IMZ55_17360 [Acidobacteria bacterium]|nr:hypothetical protein [Acidobacteriota bacterium]